MSEVTRLPGAIEQGDPKAAAQLLPLVYEELRRLAAHKMAHEGKGSNRCFADDLVGDGKQENGPDMGANLTSSFQGNVTSLAKDIGRLHRIESQAISRPLILSA